MSVEDTIAKGPAGTMNKESVVEHVSSDTPVVKLEINALAKSSFEIGLEIDFKGYAPYASKSQYSIRKKLVLANQSVYELPPLSRAEFKLLGRFTDPDANSAYTRWIKNNGYYLIEAFSNKMLEGAVINNCIGEAYDPWFEI